MTRHVALKELSRADRARWDAYVRAHPQGSFFHLSGWSDALRDGFGHRPRHVFAERDGRVVGVLPLMHVKTLLFGQALASSPFCVYGGPLSDDAEALAALDARAGEIADRLGAPYVEYRGRTRSHPDWPAREGLYATFRREIDPDPEKNLSAIPRKQRAVIRKSLKNGLRAVEIDDSDRFWPLYAESVRNLGTPVFPRRYFRRLKEIFGDDCEILLVEKDGAPIAGLVTFWSGEEVLPYYAGGGAAARGLGAHDFMYWDVMRRAAERGVRIFDFGRSKIDTGPYAFKKNWGFEPQPLDYEYRVAPGRAPPDRNPLSPRYRLFVAAWRRLPLPVANFLGPRLVAGLG